MNYNLIDYFSNSNDNNFFSPYEAYLKGNLFRNLYDDYKNYKPQKIKISNEQDELLLNIGQLSFVRHELNLLLDNYPNNMDILKLFNDYQELENNQIKNYERRFGPLTISSNNMKNIPFAWENSTWPWER